MLFSEQVREIGDEEVLEDDLTEYKSPAESACDWTTYKSATISLSKEKIVFVKMKFEMYNGRGAGRVLLDNAPIISTGYIDSATVTRHTYLLLPPGSHMFRFQLSVFGGSTGYRAKIQHCYIAALNFADRIGYRDYSGEINVDANSTATIITRTFETPKARKLAVGTIKKCVCWVIFYGESPDLRRSKVRHGFEESILADFLNWKIYLNDVQQDWAERNDDCGPDTSHETYGEGAYGYFATLLDSNAQYTIKIKVYNGYGSAKNARSHITIIICPWFIHHDEYEPIVLDFPQGSTLYVVLEPLHEKPIKKIKIGKRRFVSFGDSTDFYSVASGTDILAHNYTFEFVEVSRSVLLISGYGGCVSILGVDVR